MSSYSFKGGVKGMMEMSKLAVKMRMEVGDMLQMADKFYNPEGAIEAAAELQLLGGDIAEAFGDPFTLMYEARNKPEELAKRVAKMTENVLNNTTNAVYIPTISAQKSLQRLSAYLSVAKNVARDSEFKFNIAEVVLVSAGKIMAPKTVSFCIFPVEVE
jgi:hypothetical protein